MVGWFIVSCNSLSSFGIQKGKGRSFLSHPHLPPIGVKLLVIVRWRRWQRRRLRLRCLLCCVWSMTILNRFFTDRSIDAVTSRCIYCKLAALLRDAIRYGDIWSDVRMCPSLVILLEATGLYAYVQPEEANSSSCKTCFDGFLLRCTSNR